MADDIVKAALEWAKKGVPVFPCGQNKAPLTANGHKDATTDPDQVRFLFENAPDALIGARMGAESRLFAMDFDTYKGSEAMTYMQALNDKGLLNDTQVHTTQSGGLHLLFRADGEYPNCKPATGVEVKGEGGYIIVPPSRGYAIQQEGIAYAHPKLLTELQTAKAASSSSTVDALKRSVLSGDAFHDPLTQIAARRSAQGWPIERVQRELLDILSASAASNPSHPRHSRWKAISEDSAEELSRIVGSGNDKYNPQTKFDSIRDVLQSDVAGAIADAGAHFFSPVSGVDQSSTQARGEVGSEEVLQWGTNAWPFEKDGYSSFAERDIFDQNYVAYPLFAERESVLIAAEPKAGKTAIALKLAMQVAYGENLGHDFLVTEPRPVLYFTLEGARAVEMRIKAEHDDRIVQGLDVPERDMLFVVDRPHNFATPEVRDANGAKIVLHNEMCKREFASDLGLIVIDTLTKAMPGKDQNSVEDTSELFELIGFLRSHGITATIVFIHHLSKQGGVRGSTNIEAEVDVVLGVQKDTKSGIVYMDVRRARSMDEDVGYAFKFESHFLGTTKQGHELHAPLVRLVSEGPDTVGATAAHAARYAKQMDTLIGELGVGKHDLGSIVRALAHIESITPPSGKRPNYKTKAIKETLDGVFADQINWAYGDWIFRLERDEGGYITSLSLLKAG